MIDFVTRRLWVLGVLLSLISACGTLSLRTFDSRVEFAKATIELVAKQTTEMLIAKRIKYGQAQVIRDALSDAFDSIEVIERLAVMDASTASAKLEILITTLLKIKAFLDEHKTDDT